MKMKSYMLLALILSAIAMAFTLGTMPSGLLASMPTASDALAPQSTHPPQSLEATTTPEPSRPYELYLPLVLKKAWTVKLMVYPGPSNVDYGPGIELPQGTELTPLGRYVDFVKVQWTDAGGALQDGFVWVTLLANLHASLPELSKDEVPWIERNVITADKPKVFRDTREGYMHYSVIGTAVKGSKEDVEVDVSMKAVMNEGAPNDSSNGILIDNGLRKPEDLSRALCLVYQNGGWNFGYSKGTSWEFFDRLFDTNNTQGEFSIKIDKNGQTVVVFLPNGETRTFSLQEPFYQVKDTVGILVQTGPISELHVSSLSISQAPTGEYREVAQQPEPLRSLVGRLPEDQRITIGAASGGGALIRDPRHEEILTQEFDLTMPTGEFMWSWLLRPSRTSFDFTTTDMLVDFAREHGMRERGGALVYYLDIPTWLKDGNFSREELINIMTEHIQTVVGRYKDQVDEWIVVNEAIGWDGNFTGNNPWYDVIGPEYIEIALQTAREADPDAVLILNFDKDHTSEYQQANAVYNLLAQLKAEGVPVDGVGMQMHLFINHPPTKDDVLLNMRRFGELGVKVYITELDVSLYDGQPGVTEEQLAIQAQVYKDVLEACLESEVCKSYTMWGFTDVDAWIDRGGHPDGEGEAPLIFDEDYNPKPAYFAIRDALRAAASQP